MKCLGVQKTSEGNPNNPTGSKNPKNPTFFYRPWGQKPSRFCCWKNPSLDPFRLGAISLSSWIRQPPLQTEVDIQPAEPRGHSSGADGGWFHGSPLLRKIHGTSWKITWKYPPGMKTNGWKVPEVNCFLCFFNRKITYRWFIFHCQFDYRRVY